MCIIVYKPAGKRLPSENILKNCFINNPDGAGIMIKTEQGIQIQKGYMYFKHLKNAITELEKQYNTKELEIAIHFRYATHGTINEGNCHPFPLSRKIKELTDKQGVFDSAIMHNGIISFAKKNKKLSDTQVFIRDYLTQIPINQLFNPAITDLILEATDSKFVLMSKEFNTVLIGDFIKEKNGIYYSNKGYLQKVATVKTKITEDTFYNYDTMSYYSECNFCPYYDDITMDCIYYDINPEHTEKEFSQECLIWYEEDNKQ